jgi:hypothetical protein
MNTGGQCSVKETPENADKEYCLTPNKKEKSKL